MRLADVAGQDHAVGLLLRAVASGRLAHAYLFDGPAGVGKRTAAVGLGLALVCPRAPGQGCGGCDVCRRVVAGHHPDVRVLAPASSQIVVEQAQEIVSVAATRPHEAPARIVIIDEADRLNLNAANCLLKTLEEPHPDTHIVLVTAAPDRLLPTIRSRTQRVRFSPLRVDVLVDLAVRSGADRTRAQTAAALAGGSLGRMLTLLEATDDGGPWEAVSQLRRAAGRGTAGAVFDAAAALADKEAREGLPEALALLATFYRDAIATAAQAPELVVLGERAAELARVAEIANRHRSLGPLRRALAAVAEALTALESNVNPVTALERLMFELGACEREQAA